MSSRTLHQQRNQRQRRKCARWNPPEPHKMLFQSTRDFVNAAGKKLRQVRTYIRSVGRSS